MNSTPINPFPFVFAILTSPGAIAFYKTLPREFAICFGEGVILLMATTLRAGQITRELIHSAHQVILHINQPQPIALLPVVRQRAKTSQVIPWDGQTIIITPPPKPKSKRKGRKAKA
jgi:hypothetical protein